MGKYIKRVDTKAMIIEVCKKLFYEKGYIGTRYEDIVEATNIKAGLIHYHFKKKANIAEYIYWESSNAHYSTIANTLSGEYDFEIISAVEARSYWHLLFHNENFKRFCYEIYLERIPTKREVEGIDEYFEPYIKYYNLTHDLEYLKLVRLSSLSIQMDSLINSVEGHVNLSEEEFADFDIRLIYDILNISKDRIEEILSLSKEIFSKMDIHLGPYFITIPDIKSDC